MALTYRVRCEASNRHIGEALDESGSVAFQTKPRPSLFEAARALQALNKKHQAKKED